MHTLVRSRVTVVWLVLVLATTISWSLGTESGAGDHTHRLVSAVVLAVAAFKIRLVGLYFMDLRQAPRALRAMFESYALAVCAVTIGVFLTA